MLSVSAGCMALPPAPASALLVVPTAAPLTVAYMETDTPTPLPSATPTATQLPPTPTQTATQLPPTATATASATATRVPPTATRRPPTITPTSIPVQVVAQVNLTATLPLPQPAAATPANSLPVATDLSPDETKAFDLINLERSKGGLQPLVVDPVLLFVARARASDMIVRGFYSHVDPVTHLLAAKAMLASLGVKMQASENFYSNRPYNDGFVPRATAWFMSDPPHRNNIMLWLWNRVGVGVASSPSGIAVITHEFGVR